MKNRHDLDFFSLQSTFPEVVTAADTDDNGSTHQKNSNQKGITEREFMDICLGEGALNRRKSLRVGASGPNSYSCSHGNQPLNEFIHF